MLPATGAAGAAFLRGLRRVGGVPPDPPDGAMTGTHASRAVDCDEFAERRAKSTGSQRKARVPRQISFFREGLFTTHRAPGASRAAAVERRAEMDVFCRCAGCHGCSGVRNPLGGPCDKEPQRYKIKGKSGKPDREGFRAYCKPCLRKQEQARAARSSATELGYVPAGSLRARQAGHDHVPGNRPRIVLFGDSITEQSFGDGGFGAALADKYRRHADVLLRGYSGYNSRDAVALLKHVLPLDDPTPPVLVTVCFGANDAVKETSAMADVQGCPLAEYAENLRAILNHLARLDPPPRVLVMTPPPVNAQRWKRTCDENQYHDDPTPDRDLNRTGRYAHAALGVARAFASKAKAGAENRDPFDVAGLNLFDKLLGVDGWEETLLSDGLHLSKDGYELVTSLIVDALERTLDLEADENPSDFPSFLDVDHREPSASVDAFVAKKMRAARGEEFEM